MNSIRNLFHNPTIEKTWPDIEGGGVSPWYLETPPFPQPHLAMSMYLQTNKMEINNVFLFTQDNLSTSKCGRHKFA